MLCVVLSRALLRFSVCVLCTVLILLCAFFMILFVTVWLVLCTIVRQCHVQFLGYTVCRVYFVLFAYFRFVMCMFWLRYAHVLN